MFIGRKNELRVLTEDYERIGFSMSVIYGRRRIGKSTLIAEFLKGKKSIFYTATKVGAERNTELFAKQLLMCVEPSLDGVFFPDMDAVLHYLTGKLGDEKLILVIDELPYWAEKDSALLSIFQKYIDTEWLDKNLMLIFCGSALSFMENKVLSEKSPLFGRRSSQIKLEAFDYRDSALFVPSYSLEDKAISYGITGGVPKYLSLLDETKSIHENIKALFFRSSGYLYDESRNLLTQEFQDVTIVNNIIEGIASGKNTVNEISQFIRESTQTVLYSLERLIGIGLVEKKFCITEEKNKKKTQYVLRDTMFRFWYAFIPQATSLIEIGQGDKYYDLIVKKELHHFMGSVFEDMCRSYILHAGVNGTLDCLVTQVGSWWGTEIIEDEEQGKIQRSADIDVVGISEFEKAAVVGECKFKNEKIDKSVYETLLRRSNLISKKYRIKKYLLFSLSGYSDWFDMAENPELSLLTLKDIY